MTTPPASATSATVPLALHARHITKHFGSVAAVSDVSFDVADGELMVLVGPSGCGKSTMLRMIAGLIPIESGTIELAGATVDDGKNSWPPERRKVGLVFQEHALFPHLTVADNIAFGVRTRAAQRGQRVAEMLELIDLPDHGKRFPHELSGGERQRVALARALAPEPALMLLDEPFASLDPNLRADLRHEIVRALHATGTPAVFVTHDQDEAMALGDRVAVMRSGRIVQIDRPENVFHRPADRFVASFMGEADFVTMAELDGTPNGSSSPESGQGSIVMVRPDDIEFTADVDGSAVVEDREFRGSLWCYTIRLADGSRVRSNRAHISAVDVGSRVDVNVVPGHTPVPMHSAD